MLKEPRAGRVKTRLGHDIGMTAAAWWFRHQTASLLRRMEDPRWRVVLSVAPDQTLSRATWPTHLPRMPQGLGSLGARMARVFRSLPSGPVVLIGGDIPGVMPAHIEKAFRALGDHDAVFGPAPDGGFWLVGLKRMSIPAGLFEGVRWSSAHALSDTVKTLPGARIAYVDVLRDVDTGRDLDEHP